MTVCECRSRAQCGRDGPAAAKGSGEQSLARLLYPRLEDAWLLLADRLFYGWDDWCVPADAGTDLLWRVRDELNLPCLETLPDGSYRSVVMKASLRGARRDGLVEAARRGRTSIRPWPGTSGSWSARSPTGPARTP